jgi:branched-chain amino acid transport system substrate-binding protein
MTMPAILLALALLALPAGAFAAGPAKIGVSVPLTGPMAEAGHFLLWGVEIAVAEANAQAGAAAAPVEAVILDDETNPKKAAANLARLMEQDKVAAVIGPANSASAVSMIPIAQKARMPLMLLTATATGLTLIHQGEPGGNYIFRATLPDREQIRFLLNWAAARYQRIAIACDTTPYGQSCRQDMTELMAERGMTPAAVVQFGQGDMDMAAQCKELAQAAPQAVAVLTLPSEVASFVRSADKAGLRTDLIGQYPFFLQPIKELPERLSSGLTGVFGSSPDASPKARDIDRLVRERYGYTGYYPFKFVETGYEGAKILIQAIRASGSLEGPAIRKALESLERFEGAARVFERPFTEDSHDLYKAQDLYMGVWRDGKVERLK